MGVSAHESSFGSTNEVKNWVGPIGKAALALATMQPVAQFRRTQKIMQLVA
jgi:hypothetical protein